MDGIICADCDSEIEYSDHVNADSDAICDICALRYCACSNCRGIVAVDSVTLVSGFGSVCRDCYNSNYFTCDSCGDIMNMDDYGDNGWCNYCCDNNNDRSILPYHPDISWSYQGLDEPNNPMCGIEIEVEGNSNCADTISDDYSRFFCTEDSSLKSGFEIVSHPSNFEKWHADTMRLKSLCLTLDDNEMLSHSTDTCGLHVHVSRKNMTTISLIKLGIFAHTHKGELTVLARRHTNYAKFKDVKGCKKNAGQNDDRYEAINFQPKKTVEFRLWRGTIKYSTILSSIELSVAMMLFCRDIISMVALNDYAKAWSLFTDYLIDNPHKFSFALEYCNKKGVL